MHFSIHVLKKQIAAMTGARSVGFEACNYAAELISTWPPMGDPVSRVSFVPSAQETFRLCCAPASYQFASGACPGPLTRRGPALLRPRPGDRTSTHRPSGQSRKDESSISSPSLSVSARQASACVASVPAGEAPHDHDGKDSGAPQREWAGAGAPLAQIFESYMAMHSRNERFLFFAQD